MAGFIVLEDGRAYAANNFGFRATVAAIAGALPHSAEGMALSQWLLDESGVVQTYLNVDVRELASATKETFLTATVNAYAIQKELGSNGWESSEFWQSWINRFADLVRMIECVKRSESPNEFNPHMDGLIPPTSERVGPGW